MRGPQFTLRQIAVAIAVIGVFCAFFVTNPMASLFLATQSLAIASGFLIALLVRRSVEKFSGISMKSPRILLILILAAIGVAALAFTIVNSGALQFDFNFYWLHFALIFSLPFLLGFVIYQVSQGPFRFRLTAETLTLIALLALTGWTWRPPQVCSRARRRCRMHWLQRSRLGLRKRTTQRDATPFSDARATGSVAELSRCDVRRSGMG